MGFFDRFTSKKAAPAPANSTPAPVEPTAPTPVVGAKERLATAQEKLEAKDLAGAMAIYEDILATDGDRPDVLVTISGDLGSHGHVGEIIELVAPRYDAVRHGPATGLNLLQAYLAVQNTDAAQHILDILFGLKRPELEERLYGFSNALAELLTNAKKGGAAAADEHGTPVNLPKVGLITISKPIWFYGLEPLAGQILPPKEGRLRRIAFAQLAVPGLADVAGLMERPEDELGRISRALPLWFAETFYFSGNYAPVAAIGMVTQPEKPSRLAIFAGEWTTDNLRQLVDSNQDGLDYIVTGALNLTGGDYDVTLRLFEVKGFRERKRFTARWSPATADGELSKLHSEVRRFMEWSPASASLAYVPPTKPRAWLETLGASGGLFLADKGILPVDVLRPLEADIAQAAELAATGEAASLAYLTIRARGAKLGTKLADQPALARSILVQQAEQIIG